MIKDYFTIGELSNLFNINTKTLRYYDEIGLFTPVKRDPDTGYRYYQFNQLYELASIRYLRKLEYSIQNINNYMKSRKVDSVLEKFKEQSLELHKKWDELIRIDNIIQRKILFIEQELPKVQFDNFETRHYDNRKFMPIGNEEELYKSDIFYFYPTIAFIDKDKSFGSFLLEGYEDDIGITKYSIIPEGDFLCGYHKGTYETISETINRVYEMNKDYKLDNKAVNFNIIDQFVESEVDNYVTCIQIRILN